MTFAIDPGNELSAYVLLDDELRPVEFGKIPNDDLLLLIAHKYIHVEDVAIEMVASYGMPVGEEVFETCLWIGRYIQLFAGAKATPKKIYRKKDVCMNICMDVKAKDSNIRQALIDRFGPVGTKKNPGWFYGVSKDVWSAIAVGVTYNDKYKKKA